MTRKIDLWSVLVVNRPSKISVKPLLEKDLNFFLKRFNNFIDAELRHVEIVSPTTISITIAAQDEARAFDWISVKLEFSAVSDAKLLDANRLSFVDMSDGVTLLYKDNVFAFAISKYSNLSAIKSSICYIIGSELKYQEGLF